MLGPYRPGSIPWGPNHGHPLNQGMRGWWIVAPPIDGGPTWHSLKGGIFPGTLTGFTAKAWYGSTQRWGRIQFDGSTNYVTVPVAAGVATTRVFTWACWFATTTTGLNTTFIGECENHNPPAIFQIAMDQTTGIHCAATLRDSSSHLVTFDGTVVVNDGNWHHVVVTADGATLSMYIDGIADGSTSMATVGTTTITDVSFGTLVYISNPLAGFQWAGSLDDVRNWTRTLSASEVASLYRESRAGYPEALLWWRPRKHWLMSAGGVVTYFPYPARTLTGFPLGSAAKNA